MFYYKTFDETIFKRVFNTFLKVVEAKNMAWKWAQKVDMAERGN